MKKNIIIALLIAGGLGMSSCKKSLDLLPTDTFNEANAFQNIADLRAGLNGAYARLQNYGDVIYATSLVSDETKIGNGNNGQGLFTYRWQYNSDPTSGGDVISIIDDAYIIIDQANRVLKYVPTASASTLEEPQRPYIKGQLLAIRAFGHFMALQGYSNNYNPADPLGIPIMLESNILATPGRNTMGEVMTQIETDLSEAKTLCAGQPFSDVSFNVINIAALQARIALYKGDYNAAITYATEVISANNKPLVSGANFTGIWVDLNQNEILLRTVSTSAFMGSYYTTTGNNIYISPSDKLVASYATNDIRRIAYIGGTPGAYYVNKYYTSSRGGRVVDVKIFRTSEMYLIRAEANAKKSSPDLTAAAADLNAVRAARISGYVNETFTSATALVTAILDERFKELAFEGHRFYDLKRSNLPVQRLTSDANAAWLTLPAGDYRFVFPIPSTEFNVNPNMVQNPGY